MNDEMPAGPAWIPPFLAALADTGKVGRAIESAGISPTAVYFQRRTNHRFAEAWQAARGPNALSARSTVAAHDSGRVRSPGWRTRFLEALAETSNVAASALRANVPIGTVYKVRRLDTAFAAKWREALLEGYDNLEMEVLGHLRDAAPTRKMDVAAAMRLLVLHRETVARERALREDEDEQEVLDSIDRFIDEMRERRTANTAILTEADDDDGAE
jgi:hypothetical protein